MSRYLSSRKQWVETRVWRPPPEKFGVILFGIPNCFLKIYSSTKSTDLIVRKEFIPFPLIFGRVGDHDVDDH